MAHVSTSSPVRVPVSLSGSRVAWLVAVACLSLAASGCSASAEADDDGVATSDEALTRTEASFVGIYENGAANGGDFVRLTLDDDNRFTASVDIRHVALCLPTQSCTETREGTWTLRRSGAGYTLRLSPRQGATEVHTIIVGATEAAPVRFVRGTRTQSLNRRPLQKIAGYDFGGPDVVLAPGPREACTAATNATADACIAAGGQFRRAEGCDVICSVPIASGGAVAGFDFAGARTARPAPAGQMCTAILRPEAEACTRTGGRVTVTAGCGTLCSRPIAVAPKVSGFDFSGLRVMNGPSPHLLCGATDAVAAACDAAGGTTTLASGCSRLCSVPVVRGMAPAEVVLEPFSTPLFMIPNAHPNPNCFVATRFDLENGFAMPRATLDEFVGGTCGLYVTSNPRRYDLSLESRTCGSKVWVGSGKDDAGNPYTLRITDHRDRYCEDIVPALFVVEESSPVGISRTRYSF
ncbi:MAG: hypothetical protein U0169_00455 [Polyangiaceae bacterium]